MGFIDRTTKRDFVVIYPPKFKGSKHPDLTGIESFFGDVTDYLTENYLKRKKFHMLGSISIYFLAKSLMRR